MDYICLEGITGGYKGLHGVTRGYRELQVARRGYRGLQGVSKGYRRLRSFSLEEFFLDSFRKRDVLQLGNSLQLHFFFCFYHMQTLAGGFMGMRSSGLEKNNNNIQQEKY